MRDSQDHSPLSQNSRDGQTQFSRILNADLMIGNLSRRLLYKRDFSTGGQRIIRGLCKEFCIVRTRVGIIF